MRAIEFLKESEVDEMALAKYQPLGDFTKPGPFRGVDKKLVPHPKNQLKHKSSLKRPHMILDYSLVIYQEQDDMLSMDQWGQMV